MRFKVILFMLFSLGTFLAKAQEKIVVPEQIKTELRHIAESGVDSAQIGSPQIFTIRFTIKQDGSLENLVFSEETQSKVKAVISKKLLQSKIIWKKFSQKNKINTKIEFIIPVLYFVEFNGEHSIDAKEVISKFQNAFTFKNESTTEKGCLSFLMPPCIHTSQITR